MLIFQRLDYLDRGAWSVGTTYSCICDISPQSDKFTNGPTVFFYMCMSKLYHCFPLVCIKLNSKFYDKSFIYKELRIYSTLYGLSIT